MSTFTKAKQEYLLFRFSEKPIPLKKSITHDHILVSLEDALGYARSNLHASERVDYVYNQVLELVEDESLDENEIREVVTALLDSLHIYGYYEFTRSSNALFLEDEGYLALAVIVDSSESKVDFSPKLTLQFIDSESN
jgi:hypothetical protein